MSLPGLSSGDDADMRLGGVYPCSIKAAIACFGLSIMVISAGSASGATASNNGDRSCDQKAIARILDQTGPADGKPMLSAKLNIALSEELLKCSRSGNAGHEFYASSPQFDLLQAAGALSLAADNLKILHQQRRACFLMAKAAGLFQAVIDEKPAPSGLGNNNLQKFARIGLYTVQKSQKACKFH